MPVELKDNERKDIEIHLSDICLQLCLYLNAGLVVSVAIEQLVNTLSQKESMTAKLFVFVDREAKKKNIPFENELFIAAKSMKSRTLLRFASIIIDNQSKGTELSEKLERERLRMQSERLSGGKAKAKEAETKLCFPLMLLLIVLVVICIAPAMMNM